MMSTPSMPTHAMRLAAVMRVTTLTARRMAAQTR
jgi:hypothetical protein